jgi:hypothetical protein
VPHRAPSLLAPALLDPAGSPLWFTGMFCLPGWGVGRNAGCWKLCRWRCAELSLVASTKRGPAAMNFDFTPVPSVASQTELNVVRADLTTLRSALN